MDPFTTAIEDRAETFLAGLEGLVEGATVPVLFAELALIGALWLAATLLARRLEPRLEARLRRIKGRPRLLRLLVVLLRRLKPAVFAGLLILAAALLDAAPGPVPTGLPWAAAQLAVAWVAIAVASRIVRNRFAARIVAVIGWCVVALALVDLLDPVARELDRHAISVGSLRLSLLAVVKAGAWLVVLIWLAGLVGGGVERRLRLNADLSPSLQVLVGKLVRIGLFLLAVVVSLTAVGLDLTALTFLSGAVGLGLGFGLQKVVSNFVSGIIILADKSIKPGDVVEIGGSVGWIRELRARFVSIETRDGRGILVPNEDFITERVVNWSFEDTRARLDVHFGAAYTADPHEVRRIARETASGVRRVLVHPAPVCHITDFGDYAVAYVLRFWIDDAQNGLTNIRGDVFLALWDAFRKAGVEIPYPQTEVTIRRTGPRMS